VALSVSVCRPTFATCFLGVVNFVWIPEFLAEETSLESEKYKIQKLAPNYFYFMLMEKKINNANKYKSRKPL
jgi:hypothetical protein